MGERDIEAIIEKSGALRLEERHLEGIELLTAALADGDDACLYYQRGRHFDLLDRVDEAVADFTRAIELAPDDKLSYFYRGCIYADSLRQPKKAIPDFLKVLEFEPDNVEAHQHLALGLVTLRLPEESLQFAEEALRLAPQDALTHFCLGEVQLGLKQYQDAVRSFARAVGLDNEAPHCWAALARAHHSAGGPDSLKLSYEARMKAHQIDPENPRHLYSLADLHWEMGNRGGAIANLHRARSLNPDAMLLFLMGSLHLKLGNRSEAITDLHRARSLASDETLLEVIDLRLAEVEKTSTDK